MTVAVGTIVARRTLPYARVLAASFRARHPDVPFFVALADEVGYFDPADEPFTLLPWRTLSVPTPDRLRFQYNQQELTYALTPFLLRHMLDLGFRSAIYLKQESLVVGDLAPVFECVGRHSILLTPHLASPLMGGERAARELNILQCGVFNVGLLGVTDGASGRDFLRWWQDRMVTHCRRAVTEGMHFEQRWLDLVPAYFDGVHISRDPGINVGHWNLPERADHLSEWRLLRFSGFDPEEATAITRHSGRLTTENVGGAVAELFERYRSLLLAAGYRDARAWPYAYGQFDNGVPIPDVAREMYRDVGETLGDPFRTWFGWLNEEEGGLTRLWAEVRRRRGDVVAAYPFIDGEFWAWAERHGRREHGIADVFAPRQGGANR